MSIIDGDRSDGGVAEYLRELARKEPLLTRALISGERGSRRTTLSINEKDGDRYVVIEVEKLPVILLHADDLAKQLRKLNYAVEDRQNLEPLY